MIFKTLLFRAQVDGKGYSFASNGERLSARMDFLKSYLPGPVVDIFLPVLIILALGYMLVPKIIAKLKESGLWDRAVDKVGGEKLRLMQFEREISRLQKSGDILGAGRLYEQAEWFPEAINLYIEAEDYVSAAALYEQLEQWERAADMYFKAEDWKRGSKMLVKVGKHTEAAKHYEQHGQKIDAAKLYFDGGQYDRAAQLYEEVSYFPQAAKCFEKLGQYIKAAENYEQQWSASTSVGGSGLIATGSAKEAKIAFHAGQLYEKGGAPERAAELYKRAGLTREAAVLAAKEGRYKDAAEMLLKEEKLDEAAVMFEKAGETGRAALLLGEIAFHQGDHATAAARFLAGGDNLRAAELYETVGDLESAAQCYVKSDALIPAANVYVRAHENLKAAELFERGGDFQQAARLFEESGERVRSSLLYEKSRQFYEAGKLAHALGDGDRAIQLLQQVDSNHEHYDTATLLLSQLFINKNMPALAIDKLKRLLGEQQIGTSNIEQFYALGLAYERLGNTAEAVATYRRIMTERYGYQDVEQRIARLSNAAPVAAPAAASPVASPLPPSAAPVPAPAASAAVAPAAAAPPPALVRPPAPGSPPLQLGEELGKGLLGTTYRATDVRNQRLVVVKLLRPESAAQPSRGPTVPRGGSGGSLPRPSECDSVARPRRHAGLQGGRDRIRGRVRSRELPQPEQAHLGEAIGGPAHHDLSRSRIRPRAKPLPSRPEAIEHSGGKRREAPHRRIRARRAEVARARARRRVSVSRVSEWRCVRRTRRHLRPRRRDLSRPHRTPPREPGALAERLRPATAPGRARGSGISRSNPLAVSRPRSG